MFLRVNRFFVIREIGVYRVRKRGIDRKLTWNRDLQSLSWSWNSPFSHVNLWKMTFSIMKSWCWSLVHCLYLKIYNTKSWNRQFCGVKTWNAPNIFREKHKRHQYVKTTSQLRFGVIMTLSLRDVSAVLSYVIRRCMLSRSTSSMSFLHIKHVKCWWLILWLFCFPNPPNHPTVIFR